MPVTEKCARWMRANAMLCIEGLIALEHRDPAALASFFRSMRKIQRVNKRAVIRAARGGANVAPAKLITPPLAAPTPAWKHEIEELRD